MTKLSLRAVLIFPYIALIVFLALAIGLLSYKTGHRAVQTVSNHLLEETVSRLSQAIDRHVVGSVATLEAAFPAGMLAEEDIKDNLDIVRTRLWTASSLYLDPNNYVYYGNKAGQAIGLYRHSVDSGELRVKFTPDEHRSFYQINGINGEPKLSSIEEKNFDPRVRPWFQAGWKNPDDIWTSVYIDFRTHNLVATRARQVHGINHEFEGVVATDMSLKSLNDFVSNLNISENGIAFIIEPDGMLIASSSSSNIQQDENGLNIRVTADKSTDPLLSDIYTQLAPYLSEKMDDFEPETFIFTDKQDREIHVAYNKYEDNAGLKWINVVAMPSEDFMGGIKQNVFQTLLLGVFATTIVIIIGFSILQWVTRDLKLLSNAVSKVGSGHIEKPVNIQREDEIGDLAKNFSAMQQRLHTDYLTGLPNRYAFEQQLKTTIKVTVEQCVTADTITPFVVLFFDINNFKSINDMFGHEVGDQALKEFASRLQKNIGQNDLVARFAGDEFVVALKDVHNSNDLEPILLKMKKAFSESFEPLNSSELTLSSAIGVAYYPEDGVNAEQLLVLADKKMYLDKAEMKADKDIS
jgi:diguanylate cyclase (GGDEF)-like protein